MIIEWLRSLSGWGDEEKDGSGLKKEPSGWLMGPIQSPFDQVDLFEYILYIAI